MTRALSLTLTLLLAACASGREVIYPGYFWHQVGDGIFLHTRSDPLAGPVDGNSVVIFNHDSVVVVDTHINPAAARAVADRIQALTVHPVTHVINTHWHDDHTNGNAQFRARWPEVRIVSHRATLAALRTQWGPMEAQRLEGYAKVEPHELFAKAQRSDDPSHAIGLRVFAGYVEALKPELATLELEYPDTVFDSAFSLDARNRRIIAKWLGRGNTDGDVIVWLPDDKVLLTGDLLVAPVPFAFDSPMLQWQQTLDKLMAIDAEVLIPGHGAPQYNWQYARQVSDLLQSTIDQVRGAHDTGTPYPELATVVDLSVHEKLFTHGDPERRFAWQSYFLAPGLKSAWISLGYRIPEPGD